MQPNKTIESEVMRVYDTWLNSYLKGDVKTYNSFLDNEYRFIGSTDNEEFLSKDETTNFLKSTADQLSGKTEVRNSIKTVQQVNGITFVTHLFDGYFLNDEVWSYYGRFRFTSALHKTKKGWRFIYQHCSTPDSKAVEGETLGIEQITKENRELRDSIKRRTAELENKNRELEIEAALERVRARAMAMKHSDELIETSELMFEQIKNLGIELWSCGFSLWYDDDRYFIGYNPGPDGKMGEPLRIPLTEDVFFTTIREAKRRGDEFLVFESNGKSLEQTYHYMDGLPVVGETMRGFVEAGYPLPTYQVTHCGFFSEGHLMFITQEPNPDAIDIFKRFTKVFDQTYTRFLDLQKAEAQAREAQIELSLERIRAQVTAMKESSDLLDIVVTMRAEFVNLGHEAHYFWHMRWLPETYEKAMTSGDGTRIGMVMTLPRHIHGDIQPVAEWEKSEKPTYVLAMDVDTAVDYVNKMISLGDFEQVDPQAPTLDEIRHIGGLTFIMARTTHGEIGYSLPGVVPDPPEDAVDTLVRFAGVFDLAYKRFEDLKAAEHQHREAQIELALERVRARTMAMQKSEELADVAFVLFEQLRGLGGNLWGTGFGLCKENEDKDQFWFANENGVFPPVSIPNTADPAHKKMYDGWKKNREFLAIEGTGQDLKSHYKYMMTLPEVRPFFQKILDEGLSIPEWQQWNAAYFTHGYLLIISLEPYPEPDILKRFSKVFDQTYTRFLDLKKAEAQARESEIQLALERVRAKSMAMHKSDELADLSLELVKQVQALGIDTWFCAFNIYDDHPDGSIEWGSNGQGTFPQYRTPREGVFLDYYEAGQRGETLLINEIGEDECPAHYDYLCSLPGVGDQLLKMKDEGIPFPNSQIDHVAFFKYGYIIFITFEPVPKAHDIFKRFAKVFQQTYTRFLDLKKAESQAREAQIEAALERVRARSMGMHKSQELIEVVRQIGLELKEMGIEVHNSQIWTDISVDPNASINIWIHVEGQSYLEKFHFPLSDHPIDSELNEAIDKGQAFFAGTYSKSEAAPYFRYAFKETDLKKIPQERKDIILNAPGWTRFTVVLEESCLHFGRFNLNEFTEDEKDIFKRLGKVFGQAYTRFLDLQRAEAQAREAEIEAALERVRARSMGMHHSTELIEVVRLLDREIKGLGIQNVDATQIATDLSDPDEGVNIWIKVEEMNYLKKFHVPFIDHPSIPKLFKASRKKENFYTEKYSKAEKNRLFRLLFKYSDFRSIPEERKEVLLNSPGLVRSTVIHKNSALIFQHNGLDEFSEEHNAIFKRFGVVFEQTYTRFLDLQKAEEQAREAEIEASLERVRAKGMAMHSTNDIESATAVVFNELSRLGIDLERCGITLMNETPVAELWSTTLSHDNKEVIDIVTGYLDFRIHPLTQKSYRDWKEKKKFSTYYLVGEELKKYYDKLEKQPEYKFPKVDSYPDQQVLHSFFFNAGAIFVYTTTELSTESKNIVHRFTKVFEQTYTRFLDLRKAEAQAREAMIEAALERVRARSMAMQKSDELHDVLSVLFEQFDVLGIHPVNVFLSLFNREDKTLTYRATGTGGSRTQGQQVVSLDSLDVWQELFEKWRNDNSESVEVIYYDKEILPTLFGLLEETFSSMPENERLTIDHFPEGGYTAHGYTPFGYIGFNHTRMPTDEEKDILTKFASEFSRVYQRFLDIERAEAQARESEIQLALERVRARTMAMHNSDELGEVASVLFEQISSLTSTPDRFNIAIANEADESFDIFITDQDGVEIKNRFKADIKGSPVLSEAFDNWKNDAPHLIQDIHGKELENWIRYMGDIVGIPFNMEQVKDHRFLSSVFFSHGFIGITTHEEPDSEIIHLLERFSKVFQQTYVRFLDLQKAEEQAREAKIETALEKIRSRTMGMQSSEELPKVANIMFLEVQALGIPAWSCGYCILLEDRKSSTCIMSSEGTLQKPFLLPHYGEVSFEEWDDFVQSEETFFTQELGGKAIESHYNFMKSLPQLTPIFRQLEKAGLSLPTYQINHLCKISHGFLLFITYEPVPDAHDIFKRFTNVFEQTYTRFLDLKKAEKLALETARQSSLDRIRAEIGSMRSAEDLNQITPIIWDELKTLNIPFIRCGVFLMDKENNLSHTYLSTAQGEPIAALHLPIKGIPLVENLLEAWKENEIHTVYWDEDDFREWTQNLIDQGFIDSKKKYEAGSAPTTLDLHFLPFKHGMLYIGNTKPLSKKNLDLGQSIANAFSVAYDRYEDFNNLEQAKKKIEEAYKELEAAKDQLVQQEKLASLGQLTAGIAHEIKNPLNFVNNFSDLSVELIEEAKEEVRIQESGFRSDKSEILDLLDNIKMNLLKIHEHGSRADSIVKSMLEHSRGGSGKMEPTNLNDLVKEFSNLSFHGMRAGKHPINVDILYELDKSVGEVPLVAEDFSRVIVNLCNNAFDAMREKLETLQGFETLGGLNGYQPKLKVRTHQNGSNVTLEIEDNGPGIPEEMKDKIMQPFFTTKKGTEGTGLGLSITNDIVKAHGGKVEVYSKPDQTKFTITLNT